MLKIKFADGTEKEILQDTTVYPSGSSSVRSKMEIHMPESAMALLVFESLMSDKEKTKEIRIVETAEDGSIIREETYRHYTLLAYVGKRRVGTVSYIDGTTASATHLVAELEQPTYIEQQLEALGTRL